MLNRVEVIFHMSVRGNKRRVLALSLFAAGAVGKSGHTDKKFSLSPSRTGNRASKFQNWCES